MIIKSLLIGVLAVCVCWILFYTSDVLVCRPQYSQLYDGKGTLAVKGGPFICKGFMSNARSCGIIEILNEFIFYTAIIGVSIWDNLDEVPTFVYFVFFGSAGLTYFIQYRKHYGNRKESHK